MGFSYKGIYKSQVFFFSRCKTLLTVYLIFRVLPKCVQLAELMASKMQPWHPSLQMQIFSSLRMLTALFAGGRSQGGCLGCTYVEFSGGFLFTAAGWGFGLGPERVQEGALWICWYTRLPCTSLHLVRCCRKLWVGVFAVEQQWDRYAGWKLLSFHAAEQISRCAAKFLERRVGTGAGDEVHVIIHQLSFVISFLGRKAYPWHVQLISWDSSVAGSKARPRDLWALSPSSSVTVLHPKLLLGQREREEQLSNVCCSVLPGTWNIVILGLKSDWPWTSMKLLLSRTGNWETVSYCKFS